MPTVGGLILTVQDSLFCDDPTPSTSCPKHPTRLRFAFSVNEILEHTTTHKIETQIAQSIRSTTLEALLAHAAVHQDIRTMLRSVWTLHVMQSIAHCHVFSVVWQMGKKASHQIGWQSKHPKH
jgi:hypothetical protein